MQSNASTVKEYIDSLPADRQPMIRKVRALVRKHLPKGYQETMNWGMICYELPLSRYPETYNKKPLMVAALASQKNHCSLYLTCAYQENAAEKALKAGFAKHGKKLNMGKSCVRFKSLDDLHLPTIAGLLEQQDVESFIESYETGRASGGC